MRTVFAAARVVLALACIMCAACIDLPRLSPAPGRADLPPPTQGNAAADSQALRVGAWNVRKLGFDANKELASMARVIDAHFDLIALIELMWTERGPLLPELLFQLGPDWSGHLTSSPRPNPPSPHSEYYAVLYRPRLVAPCAELSELRFTLDGDGSAESGNVGLFLREPAFGCYRTEPSLGARDFLLAVYHARWGSGQSSDIASEVRHVDRVFAELSQHLPHELERFMIGDFNLTPSDLAPLTRARDRTRGQGSTLDAEGRVSTHLYDHLLAFGATANAALVDDAEVLDVRSEADNPETFRDRVSDHLPIVARLPFAPDED